MRQRPRVYVPPVDPGQIPPPSREIYGIMGEANIFRMLEDFYRELERSSLRPLFPEDMAAASRRSAAFFVGLLGGPPLYHQRFGNPMMRARHLAFVITPRAREEWLACFERVLAEAPRRHAFPEQHLPGFRAFLHAFSSWMVNAEDAPSPRDAADAPSPPEPADTPSPRERDRGPGVR